MTMCIFAGARTREPQGCSTRPHHHERDHPLPSRPSVAAASSFSGGRRPSLSEASLSTPSPSPQCLRLPTPAGDLPPRSPLSKKPSSMGSSVSLLCARLAADPSAFETTASGNASPRCELAAIALLSTTPVHSKVCSASRISPSKPSHANYRPCSPFPRSSPCVASNSAAKATTLQNAAPPSPAHGTNEACGTDFGVTRWSPQAASPVPRKCVSSIPPPCIPAQKLTRLHKSEKHGDLLQPRPRALPRCPSQRIPKGRARDALKTVADSLRATQKGERTTDLSLRTGILDRNPCSKRGFGVEGEPYNVSPAQGYWISTATVAPRRCKEPSPLSSRETTSSDALQQASPATAHIGSRTTWEVGQRTLYPCERVFLQKEEAPTCGSRWPDGKPEKIRLPFPPATDTLHENAQPVAASWFSGNTRLSQLPCCSTAKRQRTYRAEWVEYISSTSSHVPKLAACETLFAASVPNTLISTPGEHTLLETQHAPRTQWLWKKHINTRIQHASISTACDGCDMPTSFSLQTLENPGPPLIQACLSSPTLPPRYSIGGQVAAKTLSGTERARYTKGLSGFQPQMARSSTLKLQPSTGVTDALLSLQLCGARKTAERGAPSTFFAVGEMCSRSAQPTCSPQASSLSTPGAVDCAGKGQVSMANLDGATAIYGCAGAPAEGEYLSSYTLNGRADEEIQKVAALGNRIRELESRNPALEYSSDLKGDGHHRDSTPGGAVGGESGELLLRSLNVNYYAPGSAKEKPLTEAVSDNAEEAYIYSKLQLTLKKLQEHRTALCVRDVMFETVIPTELVKRRRSPAHKTENRSTSQSRGALLNAQGCGVLPDLQHCVLEEGSFGKVYAGRFLGKLPITSARRWWRTLPICERFLQQISYHFTSPLTGLVPLHVQKAMEHNARVAIKVPVEAMMLRDPLGVLGRTLNEWKILELVREKKRIFFSEGHFEEDANIATNGIMPTQTTQSGDAACSREVGRHQYNGMGSAAAPLLFCQEQLSHETSSPYASKSWHPMHPQAEPPGVVELVGGVVHGPLDVWLVTRLAAGKDLHTRKYSRRLAEGVPIPPLAGLAMCRQLAAIVDFLHARTTQALAPKCTTADAVSRCPERRSQHLPKELLGIGGFDVPNRFVDDYKRACGHVEERELEAHLGCNLREVPVIVHRDIKPENIIVDDNWRIQLCDFGDAEATPDGVVSKISGATWLYAPVELLLCGASLHDRDARSSVCEACRKSCPGRSQDAHVSYTNANRACWSSRARSCPTLADMQNQMGGSVSHHSYCTGACINSYRGGDAVLTEKWDIWSMGCVFQEMFGLPNPMSSYVAPTDPPQVIYDKLKRKAQNGQLVPVIAPEIQGIARQIIFACLRNDPEARPSASTVLRMWGAPEQEILKDIRIPFSSPALIHLAPQTQGRTTALRERVPLREVLTFGPGTDGCKALSRAYEKNDQKEVAERSLTKSALTCSHSNTLFSFIDCIDAGTSVGRESSGQESVYMVPNIAVVQPSTCDFCVKRTVVAV